ncbi:endonuclease [Pedobacter sp. HMF7647]|uniref:Endonuclease n=1 Tax=Hufsiella arboris TaxID=2695275 RepID=A0A7K1YA31_9SPHI|nr:DNA-formamidopyrimidine glycosylase family protein [Hufsiella arboris]MXV51447.1 endonuclease [Hufsiella arboris]
MPEGPSIVILKEAVQSFKNKKIISVSGNTQKINIDLLNGKKVTDFKSWGKHFLICFDEFTVRIHFMLFGSYRINEQSKNPPRLHLEFENGELNFYACSIQLIEGPLDNIYDWSADIMSDTWNEEKAFQKLKKIPKALACDVLLDQNIFAGSGNIIKNEVLFLTRIHPLSTIENIPDAKLWELIRETAKYSFDFLRWKKEFTLKKHWLAHTKKICPRDHVDYVKAYTGKTKRRSFYCEICQKLYR